MPDDLTPQELAGVELTELATDYLDLDSLFSEQELALRDRVRRFADEHIRPHVREWYESAHFPVEIAERMGEAGLLGMHLEGYGCPGGSAIVGALS